MQLSIRILLNEELRVTPCIERIWRETLSRNCGLIRGWPKRGQFLETRLQSLSPDHAFARNIFSEQDTYFVVSFVYLRLPLRIAVYCTTDVDSFDDRFFLWHELSKHGKLWIGARNARKYSGTRYKNR